MRPNGEKAAFSSKNGFERKKEAAILRFGLKFNPEPTI
jgi:hypothetical protein